MGPHIGIEFGSPRRAAACTQIRSGWLADTTAMSSNPIVASMRYAALSTVYGMLRTIGAVYPVFATQLASCSLRVQ
jgi:hypothetical protein